jgi:hypothetical protein
MALFDDQGVQLINYQNYRVIFRVDVTWMITLIFTSFQPSQ